MLCNRSDCGSMYTHVSPNVTHTRIHTDPHSGLAKSVEHYSSTSYLPVREDSGEAGDVHSDISASKMGWQLVTEGLQVRKGRCRASMMVTVGLCVCVCVCVCQGR